MSIVNHLVSVSCKIIEKLQVTGWISQRELVLYLWLLVIQTTAIKEEDFEDI